jgi:hypothetical protein
MRELGRRLNTLEARQAQVQGHAHFIPILFQPWDLDLAARDAWLAEQLACDCRPECPGKRVGALVPEKAPSAKAWAERCQQWQAKRPEEDKVEADAWYARYGHNNTGEAHR